MRIGLKRNRTAGAAGEAESGTLSLGYGNRWGCLLSHRGSVLETNGWEIHIKFFDEKCKYLVFGGVGLRIGFWVGGPGSVCLDFGMIPCSDCFEIEILAP